MKTDKSLASTVQSLIKKAVEKHQLGKLDEAESLYKQVLQIQPEGTSERDSFAHQYHLIAVNNLGVLFEQQNKLEQAVESYQTALGIKSDYAEAYYNLGNVFQRQGQLDAAVQSYQQALSLNPKIAQAHNNLGNVLKQQEKLDEALKSYRQALSLKPDYSEAHCNFGIVLQKHKQFDAALKSYQQALSLKPDYAEAHCNLGTLLQERGQLEAAAASYQRALNIKPEYAEAHYNLGTLLQERGQLEAAAASYQRALSINPNNIQAQINLGNTLCQQGQLEAGLQAYQQALKIQPDCVQAKFGMAFVHLPIIYSSSEEIQLRRNNYQQYLQDLAHYYQLANLEERVKAADAVGSLQPFLLAYQDLNDRDLQQIYGKMICQLMASRYPQWSQPIALPDLKANDKIRVGFISGFFISHSNWKIPLKGWVENLDRNKFELYGYHTGSKQDGVTAKVTQVFDKFVRGPLSVEEWGEVIAKDKLHILIFPEFGMDPMTIKLGCLRLAPIQMTSWGHPNTSGLPTIDYYLSSDLMEPENAREHYTEKLVRLPNLGIHYTPLQIQPQAVSKKELGIKDDEIMFWCCQSLFKYLPDYDEVFPKIARELVSCKFVFINNGSERVTAVFHQRLSRAFGEFGLNYQDYCRFLPRLDAKAFAGTAAIADVFLDSIGWSGCNSTLEAIAHNIPVVTLPGELMRGRHSMAILKMMGIEETIAATKEDYVKIAVRLGQEAQYRQQISQQVAENKYKLYRDLKPVRALEDFLLRTLGKESSFNQEQWDDEAASKVQFLLDAAFEETKLGKLYTAENLYKQALQLQPNNINARVSLAEILQEQNRLDEAIAAYQKVLTLAPNPSIASAVYNNLGNALKTQGNLEAAVESYQKALEIRPDLVDIYYNLANVLAEQLKLDAAIESYQKALAIKPDLVIAKFGICMNQLPIIYTHFAEINIRRNNYQQHLQNLATYFKQASTQELKNASDAVGSLQPFYLAYQCLNDRDLQQIYGEMLVHIMSHCYPQWSQPIPLPDLKPNEKIRVGFVSRFFYEHSNWKIPIKGWVEHLDRSEFELFAYHTNIQLDVNTTKAAKEFDKFTQGSRSLEEWCEVIQQDKLHILIFPEFGMDPMTVKLGCLRLAPVQITSWGHPDTSGLPTIDYYLSSDLMEPKNAREHYTEKLVRLPNLSIYYTPLAIENKAISKKDLGISDNEIMFWCCQSLFKYLPNHDDIFPRIAKELTNAKFVFIQNESKNVTEVFRQRLSNAFQALRLSERDYCIFLPPMDTQTFNNTAAIADVFLDSIGWSGCNSTLEAIAHNIPVVTLPGELMRGRHSLAILKMMGIEEAIASSKEEYVQIAIRLGRDTEYRQYISQLIAQNKHKLYGDLEPIRALEEFLRNVVGKAKISTTATVAETLRLAIQEHRENRLEQAEQAYHQVLSIQPNHPEALYGLGMIAQQTGQFLEAEKLLSTAVQVQPNLVKVWFALGNLHHTQGQLSEAETAYKRAIALRPDAVSIYNNLGYTLQQQGKWSEAINCYQKALQLQPNCVEADVNLGNALHALGKLSPDKQAHYAQLNHKLGLGRQKAGDLQTAEVYFQKALELNPNYGEAYTSLGDLRKSAEVKYQLNN